MAGLFAGGDGSVGVGVEVVVVVVVRHRGWSGRVAHSGCERMECGRR